MSTYYIGADVLIKHFFFHFPFALLASAVGWGLPHHYFSIFHLQIPLLQYRFLVAVTP